MMHQDDRHDEFRPVIERLRADRPTATPLELDATKQRVLARVARPRPTTRRSFSLMRTRAAILSMLALGFTTRYDVRLGFLAIVLIATLFFMRRRRRIAERTAHVLSGEDIKLTETAEMPAQPRKSRYRKHPRR